MLSHVVFNIIVRVTRWKLVRNQLGTGSVLGIASYFRHVLGRNKLVLVNDLIILTNHIHMVIDLVSRITLALILQHSF